MRSEPLLVKRDQRSLVVVLGYPNNHVVASRLCGRVAWYFGQVNWKRLQQFLADAGFDSNAIDRSRATAPWRRAEEMRLLLLSEAASGA